MKNKRPDSNCFVDPDLLVVVLTPNNTRPDDRQRGALIRRKGKLNMSYRVENSNVSLVMGPMFCGKSTELIRHVQRYEHVGYTVAVVKPACDTRYTTDSTIFTHAKQTHNAHFTVTRLEPIVQSLQQYHVIAIDEGHFFEDIVGAVRALTRGPSKHHIIVAGLNGDYLQRPFQNISQLMAMADQVSHYQAICERCKGDAPFTIRMDDNLRNKDDTTQVLRVGGHDIYEARCRSCLPLGDSIVPEAHI